MEMLDSPESVSQQCLFAISLNQIYEGNELCSFLVVWIFLPVFYQYLSVHSIITALYMCKLGAETAPHTSSIQTTILTLSIQMPV
jgi:hypothetical protein